MWSGRSVTALTANASNADAAVEDYEMKVRWAHWAQREGEFQGFLLQGQEGNRDVRGCADRIGFSLKGLGTNYRY